MGFDLSGPASGLSLVSNAVSGVKNAIGQIFGGAGSAPKLPLANPLFNYATYDYVMGIACLSDYQLAYPDKSYMAGMRLPLICKSANMDPGNRIKTAFGSFDFFIDNVELSSQIGLEKNNNTNVLTMTFEIHEPYSMGMFMIALQQAAWNSGHDNYLDSPYLLTIDFRGNTETGSMSTVPNSSRKIPFKFKNVEMTVTEKGAVYKCEGRPVNSAALSADNAKLKTDTSIKGKTVQEVLQTGEKSLQNVINKRLQQLKTDDIVKYPDEILILFPTNTASNKPAASANDKPATATTAVAPGQVSIDELSKQLSVVRGTGNNKTLMQADAACNELGKAEINKKGDAPFGKDGEVYDPLLKVNVRGNNIVDPKTGDFRFSQDTDIINAINQVLLTSEFAKSTLAPGKISKEGFRTWWRIDTKVYHISTKENNTSTGVKPKLIVYEVVPYNVHTSKLTPPNVKAPGFEELKKAAVKEYNYMYTGKNMDILSFNINFKVGFFNVMQATKLSNTMDAKRATKAGDTKEKKENNNPMGKGNEPPKDPGAQPSTVKYVANYVTTDNLGGTGLEDAATRAARLFHNSITTAADMTQLEMKIIGDPYYIAQSGQGNYTSKQVSQNLNSDGSVNYQNGEVDIVINFRTPIDINQSTGLYDFGKSTKSSPVVQWSGLYRVLKVTSNFSGGQFTQTISANRRANQEIKGPASPDKVFDSGRMTELKVPNNGDGEG